MAGLWQDLENLGAGRWKSYEQEKKQTSVASFFSVEHLVILQRLVHRGIATNLLSLQCEINKATENHCNTEANADQEMHIRICLYRHVDAAGRRNL
jgi:hypothetical protein